MTLFTHRRGCPGCDAKEREIVRLNAQLERMTGLVDAQTRRILEVADPGLNARVVQADRLNRKPVSPEPPRAAPSAPVLPGAEPAPPPTWEVERPES